MRQPSSEETQAADVTFVDRLINFRNISTAKWWSAQGRVSAQVKVRNSPGTMIIGEKSEQKRR